MSITAAGSWKGSASNWICRWIARPCRRFRPGPQFLQANLKCSTATMAATWKWASMLLALFAHTYNRPRIKKSLLFAGVFAAVAGGAVGFAVTKSDQISQFSQCFYAFAAGLLAERFGPAFHCNPGNDYFEKTDRHCFPCDVSDVTGTLNSMIPLALNAEPAFENQELAIKISGTSRICLPYSGKEDFRQYLDPQGWRGKRHQSFRVRNPIRQSLIFQLRRSKPTRVNLPLP